MKKKKKKEKLPEAVEAAFQTHAGVLMLRAEKKTITPAEQAKLDSSTIRSN